MPSRVVCFVCGSLGGEFQLHSRPREGCAFFPFLEHHDPPKGSRIPGPDGIVDSCSVCYAFLTQQWESYERSNTPAIKRLYWLKRVDDGQFTGAEMKLQGEYMAQVMGLQYQPSCGDSCAPLSPDSRDGSGVGGDTDFRATRKVTNQDDGERVLDLSVPYKAESSKTSSKSSRGGEKSGREIANIKPNLDDFNFVCYTCGVESEGVASKFISSMPHVASEPFFPFLSKLTPPKGATPMSSQKVCQVCDRCFSSLCHQWLSYEHHGTPNSARIYKVNSSFYSNDSNITVGSGSDSLSSSGEVCYLCGKSWSSSKICSLYTAPVNGKNDQMYFPFIGELRRPHGARPLNPDGSVQVCVSCYRNLQAQWQHYDSEKVPFLQRRYSLLPPSSSSAAASVSRRVSTDQDDKCDVIKMEGMSRSLIHPLAVDVSKSPTSAKNQGALLSSVPLNHSSHVSSSSGGSSIPATAPDPPSRHYSTESRQHSGTVLSIPHPLQQAIERPKKVCFLCGEKCLLPKAQVLYSYPIRHEAKSANSQSMTPFFPFLANHPPAPRADPITEEGTVITCSYCYYSLLNQWRDYEESKGTADKNRWLRKYTLNEFVCFVCGMMVPRKKMRSLEVEKFLFLREHKAPPNALVMWGGESVGACASCHFSLTHQYTEFERLGLPVELRKYNWTVQHHTEENSSDAHDSSQELSTNLINEDSNTSIAEGTDDSSHGFPPTGKAHLSLSKLKSGSLPQRNQSSPSNNHNLSAATTLLSTSRASSFAAALRNLAHQVKDPQDDTMDHRASPPVSQSSRSSTPKRASSTLMLPSHHNTSSFTSPPVVTAVTAPLSAFFNGVVDHREGADRHSSQYSAHEHWGKPDLDQRPRSIESRDDRASVGKEGQQSRASSRVTPQRPPSSSSLTSQALSMYSRGFHTYRPEDEETLRLGLSLPYGMDPSTYAAAAAAAAYHPALLQQQAAFAPSSLRMSESLLLDQYRLLQSPYLPFSTAGLMSPHGVALGMPSVLATSQQYPPALLHQHHPYFSPNQQLLDAQLVAQAAMFDRSRLGAEKQREKREKDQETMSHVDKKDNLLRSSDAAGKGFSDRRDILNVPVSMPLHLSTGSSHQPSVALNSHQPSLSTSAHTASGSHKQDPRSTSSLHGFSRDNPVDKTPLNLWNIQQGSFRTENILTNKSSHEQITPSSQSVRDYTSSLHLNDANHTTSTASSHDQLKIPDKTYHSQPLKTASSKSPAEKSRDLGSLFRPFDENTSSVKTDASLDHGHASHTYSYSGKNWRHRNSLFSSIFHPPDLKPNSSAEFTGDPNSMHLKLSEEYSKNKLHSHLPESLSLSTKSNDSSRRKDLPASTINERIERFDFKSLARECTSSSAEFQHVNDDAITTKSFLSKLDHEAAKAKRRRQKGEETDSDNEQEERMIARLTMIGRATPIPLETPDAKMNLLEYLGVTTWTKKKELERQKEIRRRRQLRLASLSPVQHELSSEELSMLKQSLSSDEATSSETHNVEIDPVQKSEFISQLGLIPLSHNQRQELPKNCVNHVESKWRKNCQGLAGRKRKHEMIDSLPKSGLDAHRSSPLNDAHLSQQNSSFQPHHHSPDKPQTSLQSATSNRSHIFSVENSMIPHMLHNPSFSKSALPPHSLATSGYPFPGMSFMGMTGMSTSMSVPPGLTTSLDPHRHALPAWPGIEAVLESYQRYREEQLTETQLLQERCRQLQAERDQLEEQSQRMSRQMATEEKYRCAQRNKNF